MLGIIRLRSGTFVDLCKEEIFVYLKSTVKQTVVEYVSEFDEEALSKDEDESNMRYDGHLGASKAVLKCLKSLNKD